MKNEICSILNDDNVKHMIQMSRTPPFWNFFELLPPWLGKEDILSEAILKIYTLVNKKTIRIRNFKAYFKRSCRNLVYSYARKTYLYKFTSFEDMNETDLGREENLMDTTTMKMIDERIDYERMRKLLRERMRHPSELENIILELRLKDYSNKEVSDMLKIDIEEVKKLANRALARLRAQLKAEISRLKK